MSYMHTIIVDDVNKFRLLNHCELRRYDTEAERRPVKPHLAPQKADGPNGGFVEVVKVR